VLALLGFVIYALMVSFMSANPSSIAYALQLAGYAFVASLLLPAYLADAERRARGLRILAWLGASTVPA
jgi:hypothetical protein